MPTATAARSASSTSTHPLYDLDAAPPRDVYKLRAHEIWGGNEPAREQMLVPGFEAWLYARPHAGDAAGGDLRFVSTCAAGQIVRFMIADFAGHGAEASDFALRLRALIRKHINTPNQARFVRALNVELARLAQEGRFATAVVQTYFAPTDHFIVCNAGHPRPLLYRAAAATWALLDEQAPGLVGAADAKQTGIANLPLGILAPTTYPQFAFRLEPGDVIISYTDAVTESKAPGGEMLEEAGLLEIARQLPVGSASELGEGLLAALSRWRGGVEPDDDQTLLVLRHNASDPPDNTWARMKALGRLVGLVK